MPVQFQSSFDRIQQPLRRTQRGQEGHRGSPKIVQLGEDSAPSYQKDCVEDLRRQAQKCRGTHFTRLGLTTTFDQRMRLSNATPIVFKYLALPNGIGGRGGAQRFFMLSQNIPFEEFLIPAGSEEWEAEKARLLASGENPCATVPVVYPKLEGKETQSLIQHIATSRYLARVHEITSGDPYNDYVQDLVADEYQGFRDTWVTMSFASTDDEKAAYRKEGLPKQLTKFNALYKKFKTHPTFLSVSTKTQQPLWGDAAIFGLLRDHILTGHITEETVKDSYPELNSMYEAYESIPAVHAWIESKKP